MLGYFHITGRFRTLNTNRQSSEIPARGTDPHCHAGRRSPAPAGRVRLPPLGDGRDSPKPPWLRPESLHLKFNQKTR